jgi:hypothetical protein
MHVHPRNCGGFNTQYGRRESLFDFMFSQEILQMKPANVLVPLTYHDEQSGTPSHKSVPVRVSPSRRDPSYGVVVPTRNSASHIVIRIAAIKANVR